MKTVIPVDNGQLAADFHTSRQFQIISGSGYELSVENLDLEAPLDPAQLMLRLVQAGVGRILAAEIAPIAIGAAQAAGLMIFHGASGSAADALNLIRLGILDNMSKGSSCGSGCGSGGCGGCGSEPEATKDSSCGCGSGSCCN